MADHSRSGACQNAARSVLGRPGGERDRLADVHPGERDPPSGARLRVPADVGAGAAVVLHPTE